MSGGGGSKPQTPKARPVITSGRITGEPTVYQIGSTRIASGAPEFNIGSTNIGALLVPFVPVVVQPTIVTSNSNFGVVVPRPVAAQDAKVAAERAEIYRDAFCTNILNNVSYLINKDTITGNGSATRFRFQNRGAPINVKVTNATTDARVVISESAYTISIRPSSFSFINFDTPPADGAKYIIEYEISNEQMKKSVNITDWTNYVKNLSEVEQNLNNIKTSVIERARCLTGVSGWSLSDVTLVDDAINVTRELKSLIGRPGTTVDTCKIGDKCRLLEQNIQKIEDDLVLYKGVVVPPIPQPPVTPIINCPTIYPPLPGCGVSSPPVVQVVTPIINIDTRLGGRIFNNDKRFTYFQPGAGGYYFYGPPNGRINPNKRYRLKSEGGRSYYEEVSNNSNYSNTQSTPSGSVYFTAGPGEPPPTSLGMGLGIPPGSTIVQRLPYSTMWKTPDGRLIQKRGVVGWKNSGGVWKYRG